jgi:hypothetical protein
MLADPQIAKVWPFWQRLSVKERLELLTVDLETLQQRAASLQEDAVAGMCACSTADACEIGLQTLYTRECCF